jgi:hypothetical protein
MDTEQSRVAAREPSAPPDPSYAVALPGGEWHLWKTIALRGTGFPVDLVCRLGAPRASAAADAYLDATRARERCLADVLEQLRQRTADDPSARVRLRALRRRLRRGVIDEALAEPGLSDADLAALRVAAGQEAAAHTEACAAFEADAAMLRAAMTDIAADQQFREAALWQTGRALGYAVAALSERQGQKSRHAAEFIALLTQRYALKNDTCGFFGPAGWAELEDRPGILRIEPAPRLMSRSDVYFEGWTLDALTDTFDRHPGMKRWAAPRLRAGVWLSPDGPYVPKIGRVDLSPVERRVLGACDGATTADALAVRFRDEGVSGLTTEGEVFEVLCRLVQHRILAWRFEIPSQLHPDRALDTAIQRIGDPATRESCAAALRALVDARADVAASMGDADRLSRALEHFDTTFSSLTGEAPTRRAGHMYAGRSLLYADGCRAGVVALGRGFLDRIGPALSVVMDGGRWIVSEITTTLGESMRHCHAELREQLGGEAAIDAEIFIEHTRTSSWRDGIVMPRLAELGKRFQAAWTEVLGDPVHDTPSRRVYDLPAVAARAREIFASPGHSWSQAREMSPDLLVCANGPEAFARGEFECVLGELHCGNTIKVSALASQHPDFEYLLAALAADRGDDPAVMRLRPRRGWSARGNTVLVLPSFYRYEYGDDLVCLPACRSLPSGMLQAVDDGHSVKLRARDGSFECSPLEVFHEWMYPVVNDLILAMRVREGHTPRLTLGPLILSRERWDLPASDMPFLGAANALERFLAVRAWRQAHDMPRQVFYKAPEEPKPCYLDFDSPLYVDAFVRIARRMGPESLVGISEMCPRVDEAWLIDGRGTRYSCELRLVGCARHGRSHDQV